MKRSLLFLFLLALSTLGCARSQMIDLAMHGAPHPAPHRGERVGPYEILGGDLHCHVLPPDAPYHVSRDLPETVVLAKEEGLDFVVFTPHVPSRFFMDPLERQWVLETQAALRSKIATAATTTDVVLVPGMEYTDHRYGHIGLAFADVVQVLDDVGVGQAVREPEAFFDRWLAHGGTVTINHPALHPIPNAPIGDLRGNLSWRGFFFDPSYLPREVRFVTEHATAIETHNLSIGFLRDQFFFDDADWTLRQGTHLAEQAARKQARKIAFVGGSDSHGGYLRGTTWVLARAKTKEAIAEAIHEGRTCVRGFEGCTLEASADGQAFAPIGSSIRSNGRELVVRARGQRASYWVNGVLAGSSDPNESVRIPLPRSEDGAKRCALVRAIVGRSWSGPIYVDCDVRERGEHD